MVDAKTAGRFWTHVEIRSASECWEWIGSRHHRRGGYGRFVIAGKIRKAHRISKEIEIGRVLSPDEIVRHTCDNPPCVNPSHLLLGTRADNVHDMDARGRRKSNRGETHQSAKYSDATVAEIHELRGRGLTYRQISELTGVTKGYVGELVRGRCRNAS